MRRTAGRVARRAALLALAAAAAIAAGGLAARGRAGETAYPERAIHLIVPFPPGGPADAIARALAAKLETALGQPWVIENRAGAGGVVGTAALARSAADGYTLGLAPAGPLAIAPSMGSLDYDPAADLAPIAQVVRVPEALVAIPGLGVSSLAELIAVARQKPGAISFASTGSGGMPHVAGELLKHEAGIDLVHVPYRGAAPAVNDLLGGHADLLFADLPVLLPHIRSGKLIALALASETRAPPLPDLPTAPELGFPNLIANNWYALLAPHGTPPAILAALNRAVATALQSPDLRDQLAQQGAIPIGGTPEECAAFIQAEAARWGPLARASGAQRSD